MSWEYERSFARYRNTAGTLLVLQWYASDHEVFTDHEGQKWTRDGVVVRGYVAPKADDPRWSSAQPEGGAA